MLGKNTLLSVNSGKKKLLNNSFYCNVDLSCHVLCYIKIFPIKSHYMFY